MGSTTSKVSDSQVFVAARRKFPRAARHALETFVVDGSASEREFRLSIVRPGIARWQVVRVANSLSELLLQLEGPPSD